MFRKIRLKSGFTLVELVTTVVVIGLVAALAAPRFERAFKRVDFKGSSKDIVSMMRTARSNAISQKTPFGIAFNWTTGELKMYKEQSTPPNDSYDLGQDSVFTTLTIDSTYTNIWGMFTNNVLIFRPNGSASESGYLDMNFDDGQIHCYSMISVLASTGRVKLEYIDYY
jgi:prepilin-type N-terminal cleavage/methylation domain-containing protein